MAITPEQRDDILKVIVGLFDAAPGGTNLSEVSKIVEGGASVNDLAQLLAAHSLFVNGVMAGKVTVDDQVQVLMDHFGVVADDDAASAGSQAKAYFTDRVGNGDNFGDIVFDAITFLSTTEDPLFADASALLANKILVAREYSERYSSSDLNVLQSILAGVTATSPATEAAAIAYLSSVVVVNPTNLTFGEDNFPGTAANDTFVAGIVNDGAGNLVDSLQDADILNGSAGRDTLNATLSIGGTTTPSLTSVEVVNLRNIDNDATVDFADSTGVEEIWNNVSSAARTLTYDNAPIAATFGVRNTKSVTDINTFDDVTGTEDNLGLAVTNAGSDTTDAVIDSSTDAAAVETMSVTATGDNFIDVSAFTAITSLTVSGAGSLSAVVDTTALETVDATDNSGGVTVDLSAAGNDLTVTGGSGDDDVTAGTGDDTIDVGSGDDRVAFASGTLDNLDTVEGGDEGDDTIALDEGDDVTDLDATAHTGFETLELGVATAGGNTFDNTDFGFTKVVLAGDAKGLTLDNFEGGTVEVQATQTTADLAVSSVGAEDSVSLLTNADAAVTLSGVDVTDVETVNLTTTADTDDTTYTAIETDGVTALNISGAGDVIITSLDDADNANDATTKIAAIDLTGQTGGFELVGNNLGYGTTFKLGDLGETATATYDFDGDAVNDEASEIFATTGFRDRFEFTTEFTGDIAIADGEFGGDVTDDRIDLSSFGLTGIDDLTVTDVGANLLIENDAFGGGRILLVGVNGADVNANDFVF